MKGGYKNIKPKDGKQFSKDYQPPEKWTEAKALNLGNNLINWLKEKTGNKDNCGNLFFDEFLHIENDYPVNLLSYLSKKFTPFCDLLKRAKKIQEIKLMKWGVLGKLNAPMTKFVLINNHDWKDKTEIKSNIDTIHPDTILFLKELNEKLDKRI